MRILLIVNTYATNYDLTRRRVVEKALSADHKLEVVETTRHGHGLPIAQGAVSDGFDAVVTWGGDGTVNEAANGLVGTDIGLGVIPGGSTNVTARTLGIAGDVTRATGQLLQWLAEGRKRRIDLGKAGERYFTFACGAGFDAAIVKEVEARSMLKRAIGPSVYLAAALAVFNNGYERSRPLLKVRFPDGTESPPLFFAIFSKSSPFTYLGNRPFVVSPKAAHGRPPTVMGMTRMSFLPVLGVVSSAFARQRHLERSRFTYHREFTEAEAIGFRPFDMQVDGEHRGMRERFTVTWEQHCLDVYC